MRPPNEDELAEIIEQHLTAAGLAEALKPILSEFLRQRDQDGKDLATDQLLNAIYLLMQEGMPTDQERDALRDKLLRPLSGPGA